MKSWYFNITVGGNSCVACIDCNQPFFMHVFRESGFKRAVLVPGLGVYAAFLRPAQDVI